MDKKNHWENIYKTKEPHEVSWTQAVPKISLQLIHNCNLSKNANIIDVGGGDSNLVDHLLDLGYTNISVLDISKAAIERAKKRLGERQSKIKWIVSDITDFEPKENYDCWHDRASFHFLTEKAEIKKYIELATYSLKEKGNCILGTFSTDGPKKCGGIQITQYSENSLTHRFSHSFSRVECLRSDHATPFNSIQNFVYCRFLRNN